MSRISARYRTPCGGGVWQNLRLADFVQYNATPGNFVSAAPTDLGGALGWSIPLLGGAGKSVADPFDGWHAISANPLTDINGVSLTTREWVAWLGLHEVSGVAASMDIDIVIGVCNVAIDGATNDWIGCGFRLPATRTNLTTQGTNGVSTLTATTGLTTIRRIRFPVIKTGTVTSDLGRPVVPYQSAANANLNVNNGAASAATSYAAGGGLGWADAVPRLFIAAYRTSVTDTTTRTPVYQPLGAPVIAFTPPS